MSPLVAAAREDKSVFNSMNVINSMMAVLNTVVIIISSHSGFASDGSSRFDALWQIVVFLRHRYSSTSRGSHYMGGTRACTENRDAMDTCL